MAIIIQGMSSGIYIGTGTNLGDREQNLADALSLLGLPIVVVSSIYETEPVGYLQQPWFLNQVICVETEFSPKKLLDLCQHVESQMGRVREIPKGPRSMDLDILFYHDLILDNPGLQVPHPGIPDRRFVLVPMNEIAPDFIHPVFQRPISALLSSCTDRSIVKHF